MQRGPGPRDPRSPSQRSQARASPWGWQKWVCGRAVCRGSRRRHVLLSNMIIRLFDYFLSPGDGKRCAGASLTRLVGRLMRPAQHASASMVFLGRGGRGGAARFRAAQRDVLNNRSVRGFIQRDKNRNHGRLPPLFLDKTVTVARCGGERWTRGRGVRGGKYVQLHVRRRCLHCTPWQHVCSRLDWTRQGWMRPVPQSGERWTAQCEANLSAVPVQVWFILEREARTSVVFFGGDSCGDSGACRPTPTCPSSQCDEQQ